MQMPRMGMGIWGWAESGKPRLARAVTRVLDEIVRSSVLLVLDSKNVNKGIKYL